MILEIFLKEKKSDPFFAKIIFPNFPRVPVSNDWSQFDF